MKRLFTLLAALLCLSPAVHAQGMGQPGFYGRIEIGTAQQPPLLISDAIMGNPGVYTGQPVYMHVPRAHAYAWSRYCHLYGACDWMVYFVDNDWYDTVYVPGFRSGIFTYAPAPVYVAPPVYYPRPYYGPPPRYYHPPPPPNVRPPPYPGAPQWQAPPPADMNRYERPPRHERPPIQRPPP
ncbi:MAG: hypothetical protein KGL40_00520 [Rhodocyclaceae bacterium]|nr:hypothetical protein [Rhodocyclaceae bacterium]